MGASQMMLVIAGMLLLSVIILRMNTAMLYTDQITMSSEANMHALTMANSMISEASSKRFDEKSTSSLNNVALLTEISNLGPDAGEVISSQFDDFDDYHNYSDSSNGYKLSVAISYLLPSGSTIDSGSVAHRTFYKKMVVSVTSPVENSDGTYDIVTASKIYGYWPAMANGTKPTTVPPTGSSSSSSSSTSSSGGSSSSSTSSSSSSTSSGGSGSSTSSSSSSSGSPPPPPPPPIYLR